LYTRSILREPFFFLDVDLEFGIALNGIDGLSELLVQFLRVGDSTDVNYRGTGIRGSDFDGGTGSTAAATLEAKVTNSEELDVLDAGAAKTSSSLDVRGGNSPLGPSAPISESSTA